MDEEEAELLRRIKEGEQALYDSFFVTYLYIAEPFYQPAARTAKKVENF